MSKYEKWKEFLCDLLCKEMETLEKCVSYQNLKCVEKLIKSIHGLDEIEMAGTVKDFVEERYGYGGGYQERKMHPAHYHMKYSGGAMGVYNAVDPYTTYADGKDMGMPYNPHSGMPRTYDPYGSGVYDAYSGGRSGDRNGGMGRGGRRSGDGGRTGSRGNPGGGRMTTYDDWDEDKHGDRYMVRQENGVPIITPYNEWKQGMIPKKLTEEQYREWAGSMTNADGTTGPHFTKEQAKQIQEKKNMQDIDPVAFWVALNASYSDLCDFFKKYGINTLDAYADYAKAFWFEDDDAVGGGKGNAEKLAAYFHAVVEH